MSRTDKGASAGVASSSDGKRKKKKAKKSRPPKKHRQGTSSHDDDANIKRQRATSSPRTHHHHQNARSSSSSTGIPSRRIPPTEAALALSAKLKDLSSRKRLQEALQLYRDATNDAIRDGHHGSIMVDCCSRCGDVEEGERIVADMEAAGLHVSVQAKTALLKGYAHSGQMQKGTELFRSMCKTRDRRDQPNVRTLNTLLRGCLWTAATLYKAREAEDKSRRIITGGVVSSEEAWRLSKDINMLFDASSYEYSIALLCHALRSEEASRRLDEMKHALGISSDGAVAESVAASTLSLARSYALLGKHERAVEYGKEATHAIDEAVAANSGNQAGGSARAGKSPTAFGGKRSWRKSNEYEGADDSRRSSSNVLFRTHRLSEMKMEAAEICNLCKDGSKSVNVLLSQYLATRLLYFSGGGTTDLSATKGEEVKTSGLDVSDTTEQLMASLWLSFGLSGAVGRCTRELSSEISSSSVFTKADRKALRKVGLNPSESVLTEDGCIDFEKVFVQNDESSASSASTYNRPINIELGAGSGDWIRMQGISKPSEDFVSVELRSDRVAQTFKKLVLSSSGAIGNVCSVGAECGSFLRHRIANHSISTIFVNHPEPPTQTYGTSDQDIANVASGFEPAHMLNSETLITAAKCLIPNGKGKLVIVTDNKWYGHLICKTFEKVMQREKGLLTQVNLDTRDGFHRVGAGVVNLYEGTPNETIGHTPPSGDAGTSYFDRLWRTGAGTHAERRKRFAIVMRSYQKGDEKKARSKQHISRSSHSHKSPGGASAGKKKPNKRKSVAKQQRRNERRLLAKKLTAEKP